MRHRKQCSPSSDAAFLKAASELGLHYFLKYSAHGLRFTNTFDLFYYFLSKQFQNIECESSPKRHFFNLALKELINLTSRIGSMLSFDVCLHDLIDVFDKSLALLSGPRRKGVCARVSCGKPGGPLRQRRYYRRRQQSGRRRPPAVVHPSMCLHADVGLRRRL